MVTATVTVTGPKGYRHTSPEFRTTGDALAWSRGFCLAPFGPLPDGSTVAIGADLYIVTVRGRLQALGSAS